MSAVRAAGQTSRRCRGTATPRSPTLRAACTVMYYGISTVPLLIGRRDEDEGQRHRHGDGIMMSCHGRCLLHLMGKNLVGVMSSI